MGKGSSGNPETEQQVALSDVAIEQWNRYQDVFVPHTNAYLKDVSGFNAKTGKFEPLREQVQQNKVSGQINASLAQGQRTTAPAGFDPSRGAYVVGNPDNTKSTAKIQAKGVQSAKDRQISAMMSAVTLGRGQADDSQVGMGDLAEQAVKDQIEENRRKQELSNTISSSLGSAVGAGAGMYVNSLQNTQKRRG